MNGGHRIQVHHKKYYNYSKIGKYINNISKYDFMKTPAELREEEQVAKDHETGTNELEKILEKIFKRGCDLGSITSRGGNFIMEYREENLPPIKAYFARYGWDCNYFPRSVAYFDENLKEMVSFMDHMFYLTPKR